MVHYETLALFIIPTVRDYLKSQWPIVTDYFP